MLSAVVIAADASIPLVASPEAIVRTLSSLVPAAIEGVIRDLTLATFGADERLAQIADHAGCALATADGAHGVIAAGLKSAKGQHLLILRAGFAPQVGFIEEVSDLFGRGRAAGSKGALLRAEPDSALTRFAPSLAPIMGLIASKGDLAKGGPDLGSLARALKGAATMRVRLRRVE
jgi:hypothetical protein